MVSRLKCEILPEVRGMAKKLCYCFFLVGQLNRNEEILFIPTDMPADLEIEEKMVIVEFY